MVNLSASVNTFKDIDPVSIMKQVIISPTRLISFKLNFKLSKPFLTNQCIMMSQSGQIHFKNFAANATRYWKCTWPFSDIMHWKIIEIAYQWNVKQLPKRAKRLQIRKMFRQIVNNKAKGQISKLVLQQNKASQIFRKTNFLPSDICFSKSLARFYFL